MYTNKQQYGRQQAPDITPDPKGGHYVLHIEDTITDTGQIGLSIYGEIRKEADHETSALRVASLIKGVIDRNPDIIGDVMVDTINRNREGKS